jgi:hypothetical protein
MTHDTKTPFFWKGKVFDFRSEEATLQNGKRATIEVVRHPGSSAIVPVRGDQSVILLPLQRRLYLNVDSVTVGILQRNGLPEPSI